jgi:hypothetical protein
MAENVLVKNSTGDPNRMKILWLFVVGVLFLGCGRHSKSSLSASKNSLAAMDEGSNHPNSAAAPGECVDGFNSFKARFHPFIRQAACAGCHGGSSSSAPPWDVPTAEDSYARVKGYVDFASVATSKIVIRSGNGHCGPACSNPETKQMFIDKINEWWINGELQCDQVAFKKTHDIGLPSTMSAANYSDISFDLGGIDPSLHDVSLKAEIKTMTSGSDNGVVGYTVRKPRIVSTRTDLSIKIKSLRLYINGAYQWYSNSFERVNTTVSVAKTQAGVGVFPLLSPETITIVGQSPTADRLTLGIQSIEISAKPTCLAQPEFEQKILPIIQAKNCMQCHGTQAGQQRAMPLMPASNVELCSQLRQYTWPTTDVMAALFGAPLSAAKMSHPVVSNFTPSEATEPLREWTKKEFP